MRLFSLLRWTRLRAALLQPRAVSSMHEHLWYQFYADTSTQRPTHDDLSADFLGKGITTKVITSVASCLSCTSLERDYIVHHWMAFLSPCILPATIPRTWTMAYCAWWRKPLYRITLPLVKPNVDIQEPGTLYLSTFGDTIELLTWHCVRYRFQFEHTR